MQYTPTTEPLIKAKTPEPDAPQPLRRSAEESIDYFLNALDGEPCRDLHSMVMAQVEEPLLRAVMQHTAGNQSRASEMLGLNRGTLRTKLRQYGLLSGPASSPAKRNFR